MFENMKLVIFFEMLLNRFKMTTSFANIARTTASTSKFIHSKNFESLGITQPTFQRRINVVSMLWINVEITLIRR